MVTVLSNGYAQRSKSRHANGNTKIAFLHVGDKIPDEYYTVNNYKNNKVKFSDLKRKLVILDLWAINCGGCIQHMPDVERLQTNFNSQIQIIMVTKNKTDEVKKLASRSENVRNNRLPFINGEQKLAHMFDYETVPTHVWIDEKGVIKYITGDEITTANNIQAFLEDKPLAFKEKKDISLNDHDYPLMVNYYPYFGNKFYIYSFLAPANDSVYNIHSSAVSGGLDLAGKHKVQNGIGYSFKTLYQMAYGHDMGNNPISNSRVVIDFKDTAGYADSSKNYIYEIILNQDIPGSRIRKYIQTQLDLFFGIKSSIQKRITPCLVIKKLKNGNNCFTTKKDTNVFQIVNSNLLKVTLPWGKFTYFLDGIECTPPFQIIDEAGIDAKLNVDLQMDIDFSDLNKVRQSLVPYGLTILKEEREMDCIVLKDIN